MAEQHPATLLLRNLVECSICNNQIENPRHLQCGHPFCSKCLQKKAQGGMLNIVCPICNKVTHTDTEKGIGRLTIGSQSLEAKKVLDEVNERGFNIKYPMCHNKVANHWCENCMELICIDCREKDSHKDHDISEASIKYGYQKYEKEHMTCNIIRKEAKEMKQIVMTFEKFIGKGLIKKIRFSYSKEVKDAKALLKKQKDRKWYELLEGA